MKHSPNKTKWFPAKSARRRRHEQVGGVDVEVSPTPFDLPQAYRFVHQGESLAVEFSYIVDGGEERIEVSTGEDIAIALGATSGRIWRIVFSTSVLGLPEDELQARVERALEQASSALHRRRVLRGRRGKRVENYTATQRIIRDSHDRLGSYAPAPAW